MKKLLILFVLFLVLSVSFSQEGGASIASLSVEMVINQNLSVTETVTVNAVNNHNMDTSYLYIFLSDTPSGLSITDSNSSFVNYTSFVANGIFTIRLIDVIEPNSSETYFLKYSNDDTVQDFDKNYVFSYPFTSYYNISSFSLILVLPRGFGITMRQSNTVSPPTSRLFSDGQQVIIEWVGDIDYLQTSTYLVFFERISLVSFSLFYLIVSGLGGFIIGGVVVFFLLKRKRKDIITMALAGDEKRVVDYVLAKGDAVFQNDIGKDLDYSKPKLSKIIHNLEDKGIVIVTHSGRKNKIDINKEIL